MAPGTHARGERQAQSAPRSRLRWRLGTPLVVLLSGALFAVSATSSQGTDLRPGRYTDLSSLVENDADRYAALESRVQALDAEVASLTESVDDNAVARYQERIDEMVDPAGLTPRTGPGVTITLSDAPDELIDELDPSVNLNPFVVHQQDIQAVVNAMWQGGATAVTIEGQRVVSTTGIKCQGSMVMLQGVPYPEPYVITAVGDPAGILTAIDADTYLDLYRSQAADPQISVGWDLVLESEVTAPAYEGLLDLSYAEPLR